jgi:hypothetical protein
MGGQGTFVGSGNWIVGDSTNFTLNCEVGVTSERTDDYGGTIAKSATKLKKVGTGKLTIATVGKINATLTVDEGTVTFNDTKLSTMVCGSNLTTINEKGHVVGQGYFNQLTMNSGAVLIPCASLYNETTPGTIKTGALMNVKEGATVNFLFNASKKSQLQPAMLTMNGTVKVTLLNGYTPQKGDEFTLWEVMRTFSGTPQFDLPELPDGLYWDVTGVNQQTGVLRVTDDPSGIGRIASEAQVDCQVFTLSGMKVAEYQTARSAAVAEARQQGLQTGTYIVKMNDGRRTETQKLVVR